MCTSRHAGGITSALMRSTTAARTGRPSSVHRKPDFGVPTRRIHRPRVPIRSDIAGNLSRHYERSIEVGGGTELAIGVHRIVGDHANPRPPEAHIQPLGVTARHRIEN